MPGGDRYIMDGDAKKAKDRYKGMEMDAYSCIRTQS